MDFYDYRTYHQVLRDQRPWRDFYREMKTAALTDAHATAVQGVPMRENFSIVLGNQLTVEWAWLELNRPYFKIFPHLIEAFAQTPLAVPAYVLKMPFPATLIRLPVDHRRPSLMVDDQHFVRSILVHSTSEMMDPDLTRMNTCPRLLAWIDLGEVNPITDLPVLSWQQIAIQEDDTIETALLRMQEPSKLMDQDVGLHVPIEIITNAVRVVVATAFLVTGADKLVEADLLTKHLDRYLRVKDPDEREALGKDLHKKAEARGKRGWTIGRGLDREILVPRRRHDSDPESAGMGHELQFQHIRGPHWHTYRVGQGRQGVKVKFVLPTTVRPDLPPKPDDHKAYRTPRQ